jgi:hypothetical protein
MLRQREGKNTREKVNEVDEKGRGIREKNVDSSRDGRLERVDKTHGGWAEKKTKGKAINTASRQPFAIRAV